MKRSANNLLFYGGLLTLWQVVVELRIWPPYLFPSPLQVLESIWIGLTDDTFLTAWWISMRRIAIGYGISVLLGILIGVAIHASEYLQSTLGALLVSVQSLPSLCWLPLAVLWFGLSENAILFVVIAGSLLAVSINTHSGLAHTPRIYAMAGRNFGAHGLRLFLYVLLPASLPHLIAGLKQAWAFAWRSLVSGEMLFVSLGLGHLLMMGRDLNDINRVIAVMLVIVATGYSVDQLLFSPVETIVRRRWGVLAG